MSHVLKTEDKINRNRNKYWKYVQSCFFTIYIILQFYVVRNYNSAELQWCEIAYFYLIVKPKV
jgi:hypothetical protein